MATGHADRQAGAVRPRGEQHQPVRPLVRHRVHSKAGSDGSGYRLELVAGFLKVAAGSRHRARHAQIPRNPP